MAESIVGNETGRESSLSNWAGPYVTSMLGKGAALSNQPYQGYSGPLTAGSSNLQNQAFQGIAGLAVPTTEMGGYQPQSFTQEGTAQQYMNPYIDVALQPQLDELRRQTEKSRVDQAGRFIRAGAYGGSRQALSDAELTRSMLFNMANTTGQGYQQAYQQGQQQFNTEQQRGLEAQNQTNQFGLTALANQMQAGQLQRDIEQQGISADRLQFEEERDYPYKQVQYQQSLLQGLPIGAQSYNYAQPSTLSEFMSGTGGTYDLLSDLFGVGPTDAEKLAAARALVAANATNVAAIATT
jgi:hypothetical protein|tara:strand:+ start:9830 stop:10717 length:888 start_codon:yes stop_codon:yes gene_type:complete